MNSVALSVIIPAHQEETVISACLTSLAQQDYTGEVQIVVAVNGCSDSTAAVARRHGQALRLRKFGLDVVEIRPASKPRALNAGDRRAIFGHRVYLDADVELTPGALSAVAEAFSRGVLFCAPQMRPAAESYFSEVYGRVWTLLPYVANDVIGAGVYAVNAAGRARWSEFPNIIADDKFARLHFARSERQLLTGTAFVMHLPDGFRELVRVRSRWIRANRQLRKQFPELAAREPLRWAGVPDFALTHRNLWRDFPAFAAVYGCAEIRSWVTHLFGCDGWERATRARRSRFDPFGTGQGHTHRSSAGPSSGVRSEARLPRRARR